MAGGAQGFLLELLVGDEELGALFTGEAELAALLRFEATLAQAQAHLGLIPSEAAQAIVAACNRFQPDWSALQAGMVKDGVIGPSLVAAVRREVGGEHGASLHFGATSQDLVDTALMLRLKTTTGILDRRLAGFVADLEGLRRDQGDVPQMAHTRMQAALPFTAGDRLDAWLRPLRRHRTRLAELVPRLLVVQLGGPIGIGVVPGAAGDGLTQEFARRLDLSPAPPWHSARDTVVELGSFLALLSGSLGKIGQDLALLAQSEVGAVGLAAGGASSAMAHKSNPVGAEVLVALARFAAGLAGTLHQALVHENERSGAAWTLEWLTLPQLVITAGASLRHARSLCAGLEFQPYSSPLP